MVFRAGCLAAALLAAAHLAACSSTGGAPAAASDATAGNADGGVRPALPDPSVFDCRATTAPERRGIEPRICGLDPACRTRQVAGHRGAGGQLGKLAPEDTLSGYRAAIAIGVDYVETDPRPTKDGRIVNIHDATVDRTTNGKGAVDELTFDEVRALQIRADRFAGDFACEKVPTLEEILLTCKGKVPVLVDANKTDRVDLLVRAIQTTDTLEWAIFDTSSVDKIDRALAIEPRLQIQIRVESVGELEAELDHFAAHPPLIVEIGDGPLREMADAAHARGRRVFTNVFLQDFAANLDGDVSHYGPIFDLGIDIVQSDRPELVLRYLGRL